MGILGCQGCVCMCTMGMVPTPLNVLPTNQVTGITPIASVMDFAPFLNIVPFGMCMSLANPTTAALTAAAFGVLTPGPCIPVPTGPWLPGCVKVLTNSGPALDISCKLMCAYGGCVQITVSPNVSIMSV